jgi:pantoate kinase
MNPQLEQAQAATQQFMQQHGLDARTMMALGEMAQEAIQDQSLYAMLREQLINAGLFKEKDLPEKTNYTILSALAGMGKFAGEM